MERKSFAHKRLSDFFVCSHMRGSSSGMGMLDVTQHCRVKIFTKDSFIILFFSLSANTAP